MSKNIKNKLYGAILGDLCGQPMELQRYKGEVTIHNPDSHITDDTVLTLATAYAIMNGLTFESVYKEFGKKYTDEKDGLGYGGSFKEWIDKPLGILNKSYGNGCLMRISPIMYLDNDTEREFLTAASCYSSHAHVKSFEYCMKLMNLYHNDILITGNTKPIEKFRQFEVTAEPTYEFIENLFYNMIENDMTTQECILKAIECGGDTDTNASIIGELSNYYNNDITQEDVEYVDSKLEKYPELLNILKQFNQWY